MYPQQPFVEPGYYGRPPYGEGFPQQQPMGPYKGASPYPQPGIPRPPKAPTTGSLIGEGTYNIDARLDRIEREIVEINRRLNTLSRRVRRIENFLNIRDDV